MQSIDDKEKESIMAKSKFQELIGWRKSLNIPWFVHVSKIEKIKKEIALKSWENNLEESKRIAKEENKYYLDVLLAIDSEMAKIDISNIHAFIGQVEIEKRKENLKKNRENM